MGWGQNSSIVCHRGVMLSKKKCWVEQRQAKTMESLSFGQSHDHNQTIEVRFEHSNDFYSSFLMLLMASVSDCMKWDHRKHSYYQFRYYAYVIYFQNF